MQLCKTKLSQVLLHAQVTRYAPDQTTRVYTGAAYQHNAGTRPNFCRRDFSHHISRHQLQQPGNCTAMFNHHQHNINPPIVYMELYLCTAKCTWNTLSEALLMLCACNLSHHCNHLAKGDLAGTTWGSMYLDSLTICEEVANVLAIWPCIVVGGIIACCCSTTAHGVIC